VNVHQKNHNKTVGVEGKENLKSSQRKDRGSRDASVRPTAYSQ
jgi:hypothetical protein